MNRILSVVVLVAMFLGGPFAVNAYAQGSDGESRYSTPRAESFKAKTGHKYHNSSVGKQKGGKEDLYEGQDPYTFDTIPEDGGYSTTSDFLGEADVLPEK
ncbi:MAG: hypothetical protein P9L88_02795 [Candidatus Tantalella remota]|nr:hypothetical protein [Candidatus Tantalella remota]